MATDRGGATATSGRALVALHAGHPRRREVALVGEREPREDLLVQLLRAREAVRIDAIGQGDDFPDVEPMPVRFLDVADQP